MDARFLFVGGLLNLLLALFKISKPYLFRWKEAMGSGEAFLWSTVYAENLGILLLLFFAYMSIFQWRELLRIGLGKTVLFPIGSLWRLWAAAQVFLYRIGEDVAWWRFFMFVSVAVLYLLTLARVAGSHSTESRTMAV